MTSLEQKFQNIMKKRPTLADVANVAGLSISTVDRVLNDRAPVREATARQVYEAADAVGYPIAPNHGQEAPTASRLGFLLLDPQQPFYRNLSDAIETAVKEMPERWDYRIDYLRDRSPAAVAARIRAMAQHCDRLAVTCYEHSLITEAIDEVEADGVEVIALLSPLGLLSSRAYMGLDNRQVGRTAAWTLTRLCGRPGKIGLFVGSHSFVGHELREMGFRSYCREQAPAFQVLEAKVNHDDPEVAYRDTLKLIEEHPDLCGLYAASGGMEGVIRALYESDAKDLCVITQELTAESRQALLDGRISLVIATPLRLLAIELVRQMTAASPNKAAGAASMFPCLLHTAENC